MVDSKSTVVVIVRRADAGRRAAAQPILVGSASCRVAIQRPACEHGRGNFASTIYPRPSRALTAPRYRWTMALGGGLTRGPRSRGLAAALGRGGRLGGRGSRRGEGA